MPFADNGIRPFSCGDSTRALLLQKAGVAHAVLDVLRTDTSNELAYSDLPLIVSGVALSQAIVKHVASPIIRPSRQQAFRPKLDSGAFAHFALCCGVCRPHRTCPIV